MYCLTYKYKYQQLNRKPVISYKYQLIRQLMFPYTQVIGIGKELALRIGQREGLSNIDIAQLRDMYFCNRKEDNQQTSKWNAG